MAVRCWLALGLTIFLTAGGRADPVADESKKLNGTWVITSVTVQGKSSAGGLKSAELSFEGAKLTFKMPDGSLYPFTYKIDPGQKPKTMDFEPTGKPAGENFRAAVYELDGDTLTMVLCALTMRPKKLTDDTWPLLILKRKK